MTKIFAKTVLDGRVKKSIKYTSKLDFEIDNFEIYVKEICEKFDSPAPIILAKHIRDYIIFGVSTFYADDFIEKVYFDKLVLETYREG